jgi:endoglucanase
MIAAQSVEHGKQVPYEAQPGDEIVNWRQHRYIRRGDARIGALVGAEGKMLCTPDRLVGEPLDTAAIDRIETYLRTAHQGVNREIQQTILAALLRDADRDLRNTEATDFHWTGGPARQISWGAMSKPESQNLVRAHFVTGDEKYLRAVILSTLSGAGANPLNMCYVTGVGSRWPQHPLHEDACVSNQPLYEGVTIGGPIDPLSRNKHPNAARFENMLYPPVAQWPATESYYDVFSYVPMNEFTVHQTMLPTSFVWGYLAARK